MQTQFAFPATEPSAAPVGVPAPTTRWAGSKRKILPWVLEAAGEVQGATVLDAFGGTASVAHGLRCRGARVTYNDYLQAPCQTAIAVVANADTILEDDESEALLHKVPGVLYDDVVASEYRGVFFLDGENEWLDVVAQNIAEMKQARKQAIAFHALFQAALSKRPYNLFHRANLSMRTNDVPRSFGNKATWETPFSELFHRFRREVNDCVVWTAGPIGSVCNEDAFDVPGTFDLVYVDPPYVSSRGGAVDYRDHYGFLEGLVGYRGWREQIDTRRKHRPLSGARSVWSSPATITDAFEQAVEHWSSASRLLISYRSDGSPSIETLRGILKRHGRSVRIERRPYKYVLSTNGRSEELLLVCD